MLEKVSRPGDVRRVSGSIPVRHRYTPGRAGEVFLTALRDGGVLLGSRCSRCDVVYAPARAFCERCFSQLSADAEVGPGGELVSFTIAFVGVDGAPLDVPVVFDRPGPDAPLVALATGLAAVASADCVVLGCDLPFAAPAVDRLLAAPAGRPVAARDPSGRMQPLCARYPREAALAACDRLIAAGELRMGRLLDELDPLAVDAPEDVLLNINTDLDLARAESLLRG